MRKRAQRLGERFVDACSQPTLSGCRAGHHAGCRHAEMRRDEPQQAVEQRIRGGVPGDERKRRSCERNGPLGSAPCSRTPAHAASLTGGTASGIDEGTVMACAQTGISSA
ncbi:hypothetical protein [Paraburkholderia sp. CNPSo 3274]|uniref:hypothetical protein n=1 Tax=Paraburkholderia sp. CNPSo 3274 TaxID=2940932 RepID=UPI0035CD3594